MTTVNPLLDPNARLVIAHRGNRIHAAENTVASLAEAIELGADAVEFDVRMTRDRVPVLMHDPNLDRTTDGHGAVADYTYAELTSLDAAARGPRPSAERAQIPTLEEVLSRFRQIPMVIEVKELRAAQATEQLVQRLGIQDRIVVGSADASVMAYFYRSELRACASMADAIRLIPRALLRLKPARPLYDVLSVPPRFRRAPIPVVAMAVAARRLGIPTHVWTVNDPKQARDLWRGGVAGIVTDDPAAMIRARSQ
jgi:glycerophosphoryl diester phosphodiesterase